jgi:hypothetical protein
MPGEGVMSITVGHCIRPSRPDGRPGRHAPCYRTTLAGSPCIAAAAVGVPSGFGCIPIRQRREMCAQLRVVGRRIARDQLPHS